MLCFLPHWNVRTLVPSESIPTPSTFLAPRSFNGRKNSLSWLEMSVRPKDFDAAKVEAEAHTLAEEIDGTIFR